MLRQQLGACAQAYRQIRKLQPKQAYFYFARDLKRGNDSELKIRLHLHSIFTPMINYSYPLREAAVMMGSGYVDKELTRASKRAIETLGEKDIYYIFTPLMPNTSTRLILKKNKTDSSIRKVWLPAEPRRPESHPGRYGPCGDRC